MIKFSKLINVFTRVKMQSGTVKILFSVLLVCVIALSILISGKFTSVEGRKSIENTAATAENTAAIADNTSSSAAETNDKPAYKIFAITNKYDADLSKDDMRKLATQLQFVYGNYSREQMDFMRSCNPDFKILRYINTFSLLGADRVRMAEDRRFDLEYYAAAALKDNIDASATTIKLNRIWDNVPVSILPSTIQGDYSKDAARYVTWLRVDNELMRIEKFDKATSEVTVTRGFSGSAAASHKADSYAFHPTYNSNGAPGMSKSSMGSKVATVSYIPDPATSLRWEDITEQAKAWVSEGYDGVWIDCLSSRSFNSVDVNGKSTQSSITKILKSIEDDEQTSDSAGLNSMRIWNFAENKFYTDDKHREYAEKGVNTVQEELEKSLGYVPALYANNITSHYYLDEGGKKRFLLPTDIKFRPLDGFCVESFASEMSNEGYAKFVENENAKVPPTIHLYNKWRNNVKLTMDAMQDRLAILPMMANAGVKNRMVSALPPEMVAPVEQFAYASFLMAVEKDAPGMFGLPVMKEAGDNQSFYLNPMFYWPIGEPIETHAPNNIDLYVPEGKRTYIRHFTNGIVLVNPTEKTDNDIQLGDSFIDPSTGEKVSSITMLPQTGRILLISK